MISLLNFNPADTICRIDSPRSLAVMRANGIGPEELLCIRKDKLSSMFNKEKPLHGEKLDDFHKHFEYRRQQKVYKLIREREGLVEKEKRQKIE